MDKIIELAKELKMELDNLPLFQEFLRVKNLVDTSTELKELKREIALAKLHNDNRHQPLLYEYHNHPLVVNYEELKNEVYDYLRQISDIVNKK